jgi:protein O-mannosyl-transferase
LDARIANMFRAYCWYLQKTFIPTGLTVFYPHPEQTLSWVLVAMSTLVICGLTAAMLWRGRNRPHLLVGWAWFVVALLPVIGLLQVGSQAYADRYAYIPHMGLFVAIVWEARAWLANFPGGDTICRLAAVVAIAACGFMTHNQVGYWKNSGTLWNHALDMIPESSLAHAHLGDLFLREGDYEQAIRHIELSLRSKRPDDRSPLIANAYFNWGRSLEALNRLPEAEEKLIAALKIDPNHLVALDELEKLLKKQGRYAEADKVSTQHAQAAKLKTKQKPDDAVAQLNLGLAMARQGNFREAVKYFEKAVQLAPQSADAHNNLGQAEADLRNYKAAKIHLLKAIELDPKMAVAHRTLGEIFEADNDVVSAKKHFLEAVRINPADVIARQHLDRLATR